MIENKNQFKKAIKEDKVKYIKRVYNLEDNNKIPVGTIGTIFSKQSNAFTIKWECLDKPTWTWYDNIEVKDNEYYYYSYVGSKFDSKLIEILKNKGIELIPLTDKEKEKVNKNTNAEYEFKFVVMTNEILEDIALDFRIENRF